MLSIRKLIFFTTIKKKIEMMRNENTLIYIIQILFETSLFLDHDKILIKNENVEVFETLDLHLSTSMFVNVMFKQLCTDKEIK